MKAFWVILCLIVCKHSLALRALQPRYCRCYCGRALPPFVLEEPLSAEGSCVAEECMLKMGCPVELVEADTVSGGLNFTGPMGVQLWVNGGKREWLSNSVDRGDVVVFWTAKSGDLQASWGLMGGASFPGAIVGVTFASFQLQSHHAVLLLPANNSTDAFLKDPTTPSFVVSMSSQFSAPTISVVIAACMVGGIILAYVVAYVVERARAPRPSHWLDPFAGSMRLIFGPVALVGGMTFLCLTLSYCFGLALNLRHVNWRRFPPISMVGTRLPEHIWFVMGFAGITFLLAQGQLVYAAICCHEQPHLRRRILSHAALGLLQAPCLFGMAVFGVMQTGVLHFTLAIAGLFALIAYEVWHIFLDRQVFPHARRWRTVCRVWYAITAIGTLVGVVLWLFGCMYCQWGAVACIFFHFTPWIVILSVPLTSTSAGQFVKLEAQDVEMLRRQ